MSLISPAVALIVAGVPLCVVNKNLSMDPKIKSILNAVVTIPVAGWLLFAFGVLSHTDDIRVSQLR